MKIASWNVNSLKVRLPHLLEWLVSAQPDVVALQETKTIDENFPQEEIEGAGYHVVFSGQKTYNGVAILSKVAAQDVVTELPGLEDPQRRVLFATIGDIRVMDVYVPNGSEVGSDKYAYKLNWLEHLQQALEAELQVHQKVVLLGDFNIAPDDRDVHDPESWKDKILCSRPERDALQRLLSAGLCDSFRKFDQDEASFSWWDYRAAGFRRNLGLRIDLILASEVLCNSCTDSEIDRVPRAWERPSDHAPVIATFE
jgi:exodeoxyribonuclease-3